MRDRQHKVAFTAFRNNLVYYLEEIAKGGEIEVVNARRGKVIVNLKAIGEIFSKNKQKLDL